MSDEPSAAVQQTSPTTASVVVARDGSLTVQFVRPDTGEIVKVELDPGGQYSLLHLRGESWREVSMQVIPGRTLRGTALKVQAARSREDGSIQAQLTTTTASGRRLARSARLEAEGRWQSTYDSLGPGGTRITGNASSAGGPADEVTMLREKFNRRGKRLWTVDTNARPVTVRANLQQIGPAGEAPGGPQGAVLSVSRATYADGSIGSDHLLASVSTTGEVRTPQTIIRTVEGRTKEGGKAITTWTIRPDGSMEVTTTIFSPPGKDGALPKHVDQWTTERATDGSVTTRHAQTETNTQLGNSAIDAAGDTQKGVTTTWERTTVDAAGQKTEERGVTTYSPFTTGTAGAESTTKSVHHPDGTTTITTETVDIYGAGTRHTTVVDQNGNPIPGRDTTEDVGNPGTGASGSAGTGSSGSAPPPCSGQDGEDGQGGDNGGDGDEGGDGEGGEGGDDTDNGGDDGAPLGDEGGPTGAGWDGGDEGIMGLLPKHARGVFGSYVVIENPLLDQDHDAYQSVPAHMTAGLTYDALVNPGVAYGSGGIASIGSEQSPDAPVKTRRTTILGVAPVPPEEEFQWDNPEVHFTYLAEVVQALKQSGDLDEVALDAAEATAKAFGAFAAAACEVT